MDLVNFRTLTIKNGMSEGYSSGRDITNTTSADNVFDQNIISINNTISGFNWVSMSGSGNVIFTLTPGTISLLTNDKYLIVTKTSNTSVDCTASGVNGLDTGTFTASNFYYVYVIYNPSSKSVNGIISLSSTTPLLPTGYTLFRRVATLVSTSGPSYKNFIQTGSSFKRVYYDYFNPSAMFNFSFTSSGTINISTIQSAPQLASNILMRIQYNNTVTNIATIGVQGGTAPISFHAINGVSTLSPVVDLPVVNGLITYSVSGSPSFSGYCLGWTEYI